MMFPRRNLRLSARRSQRCVRRPTPSGRSRNGATRPSKARALVFDLVPVLTPAGMETAFPVEAAIGVGAEIVAEALQQVRWSARTSQPVIIGQRRRESRRR